MKAVDSNLLVYASLADHPATTVCEQYLTEGSAWITNVVNLVELYRVLIAVYGVTETDADAKFADLCNALVVEDLTASLAKAALPLRRTFGIDFNDAVLLESCRQRGIAVLGTDDSRLADACAALGISVENPVAESIRTQMKHWESGNLPAKGLPRLLARVHQSTEQRDPALAGVFHSATQGLSRLV